jgi:hypothetical protein
VRIAPPPITERTLVIQSPPESVAIADTSLVLDPVDVSRLRRAPTEAQVTALWDRGAW